MSELKQEILFAGAGLNTDVDKRYMKSGSSDYRLNCTYSRHGNRGIITNSLGNKLQSLSMPTGTNKTIGSTADIENNSIIYFVYNSNSNHSIIRYNLALGTFNKIMFNSPALTFNIKEKINRARVVNGWVWWTSKHNPPRHLNIEKAIAFTEKPGTTYTASSIQRSGSSLRINVSGSYAVNNIVSLTTPISIYNRFYRVLTVGRGYITVDMPIDMGGTTGTVTKLNTDSYLKIDEEELNIIRKPPIRKPICASFYNNVLQNNNLGTSAFQFAYNYGYNDNSYSVYSPISSICIPDSGSKYGGVDIEKTADNSICIFYENGSDEVQYVNIAFRQLIETGWSEWRLVDKINTNNSTQLGKYIFKNEFIYNTVISTDIEKTFDDIPDISNGLEIVGSTYLALGGNTITKTPITSVSMSISANSDGEYNSRFGLGQRAFNSGNLISTRNDSFLSYNNYSCQRQIIIPDQNWGFESYSTLLVRISDGTNYQDIYGVNIWGYGNTSWWTVVNNLLDRLGDWGVYYPTQRKFIFNKTYNSDQYKNAYIYIGEYFNDTTGKAPEAPIQTFKNNSVDKFAIGYFDNYRRCLGVFTNDACKINIGNATSYAGGKYLLTRNRNVRIAITHTAPSWAKYYQMYHTGDLNKIFYVQAQGFLTYYVRNGVYLSFLEIKGNRVYKYDEIIASSINHAYTFEKGDRVTIIKYSNDNVSYVDVREDHEIIEYISEGNYIGLILNDFGAVPVSISGGKYIIYEIYRPKKADSSIFYEIGPVYEVGANGSHPQSPFMLYEGNSYRRLHNMNVGSIPEAFMFSQHYSEFFKSDVYSNGRIYIALDQIPSGIQNTIKISRKYIPNTQLNGLCSFDWEETTNELNEKWGEITGIISVGNMLKVFQRNKITTFYVGATELANQDSSTTLMAIDAVLGKPREGLENYGTEFGECISVDTNHIYAYDIYNSIIFRDGPNGQEDLTGIGENSIYGYLSNKSIALLESGIENISVISYYDSSEAVVYFTFIDDINPLNNDTIAFDEGTKSWISFYSFIPENYCGINNMFSFKNGDLWKHGSDEVNRCSFYGIDYPMIVKIIGNINPTLTKTFDAMTIVSNKRFDVTVEGEADLNYKNGISSIIPKEKFIAKEGKLFAAFMRNMKTRSPIAKRSDLFNGDPLRGECVEIVMTNEDKDEVLLKQVNVKCSISSGTNI